MGVAKPQIGKNYKLRGRIGVKSISEGKVMRKQYDSMMALPATLAPLL